MSAGRDELVAPVPGCHVRFRYYKKISMVLNIDCFTCPGSALCKIMRRKIYNSKLKDEELLLEFHARSDHQAKTAARAALRFNGKIQKLN